MTGRRVEVTDSAAGQTLFLNVLGTNGSVTNAVASNGTDQTGAQITLSDPPAFAMDTAIVIPRSLNDPVGFRPSYFR